MTYAPGPNSLKNLKGIDPRLFAVVMLAYKYSTVDFSVIEGVRTPERQKKLYAQGRTEPGPKVTWTLNSNHFVNPRTKFGEAVDLAPYVKGKIDWTPGPQFDAIAAAMFRAAKELGIAIRWGADWDKDGNPREKGETDSPHFELAV